MFGGKDIKLMTDTTGYLTPEQIHLILDGITQSATDDPRKTKKARRRYIIIRFLWLTGCRVSEMLQVTPEDIKKSADGTYYIRMITLKRFKRTYKTMNTSDIDALPQSMKVKGATIRIPIDRKRIQHYREVDIPSDFINELQQYIKFNRRTGKTIFPFTRQGIRLMVISVARNVGIKRVGDSTKMTGSIEKGNRQEKTIPVHPHVFRHSHALNWIKTGGDMVKLQQRLGHQSYDMTASYLNYSREDMKKESKKVFEGGQW